MAGPTRNNVPQQQPKPVVAAASYNANQTYAPQTAYQQNPQANAQPKRKTNLHIECVIQCQPLKLV